MKKYLIEAWALGMFMLSAAFFTGLLEWPALPLRRALPDAFLRRWLVACAMGLTAIALIYSAWGRRSGAHMNPAFTLTMLYLGKIGRRDATGYVLAQLVGGALAMLLGKLFFHRVLSDPSVNYVQTLPGMGGVLPAFAAEAAISFGLMLMVLYSSNSERTARYTGLFAGALVMVYITFEAPLSGMSMNPARTLASALAAGRCDYLWIYFTAPLLGMLSAARAWKTWICRKPEFRCQYH
jgi:aquaporin Z